jgi:hypothetical protein
MTEGRRSGQHTLSVKSNSSNGETSVLIKNKLYLNNVPVNVLAERPIADFTLYEIFPHILEFFKRLT